MVFGRPNEAFAELMHLEEATLQEILLACQCVKVAFKLDAETSIPLNT